MKEIKLNVKVADQEEQHTKKEKHKFQWFNDHKLS